jgi:type IV pilus assembly protein PilW
MKSTHNRGFTLIELLVAMAVVAIIMAAVVSAYQVQVRGQNTQAALTDMNQSARAALTIMSNEIATAGLDPLQNAGAGIVIANANELKFTRDIGDNAGTTFLPDGATTGPNESIDYALSGGNLTRNAKPLVRNVNALNFVYLNANGNITATVANIRSIQVTIVARAGTASGGFLFPYKNTTAYNNLQGTQVLAAQNDSFRRLALSTTINCPNLGN